MERWRSFVSLAWYDKLIEFLFRFAAKTSEPLLAIGIVYSAADVLSKGHMGYGDQTVQSVWAITQALAIESSFGVVLAYSLQSFREQDKVKAWLYLVLSALLAITGGIMLFMQFAGYEQQTANTPFLLGLFALRCTVSVGYIGLCRIRHIRLTDITDATIQITPVDTNTPVQAVDETGEAIKQLSEQIGRLNTSLTHMQTTVTEEVRTTMLKITQGEHPAVVLPQRAASKHNSQVIETNWAAQDEQDKEKLGRVRTLLAANPDITVRELAVHLACSPSTASKWKKRAQIE